MSFNKVNSDGSITRVAGGTLYADAPVGAIMPYGGATAPDGFLLCQGQEVSKTTYSELYAVIGDSFKGAKADPTSGNFYLPDLREVTLKGVGTNYAYAINNHGTIDNVGGFMEDRVQDHSHWTYLNGDVNFPFGTKTGDDTNVYHANADTENSGSSWKVLAAYIAAGRHGATTEVKAVGVNYIIKATQVGVPADFAPVDVVEDGNMKAVTSNAVAEALADTYSTTETKTNKVWIDGKPIYRKVIRYTGIITNGNTAIIGSVTGVENLITLHGTFKNNADNNRFPLGYTYAESGSTDLVLKQNMPFVVHSNGNISCVAHGFDITDINVIVEYTKTTD